MHRIHSSFCSNSRSNEVGQSSAQARQSAQSFAGTRLKGDRRDTRPSSVPRGQRLRHQFRVSYRSSQIMPAKIRADRKARG